MRDVCKVFVLAALIVDLLSSHLVLTEVTIRGKVVPGVYWEESGEKVITYEKVVPLVFEFRLRSELWSSLPVGFTKFKVLPRLFCRSDNRSTTYTTSDWYFTCPVFYHVNDFLRQYRNNYTDIHPTMRSLSRQSSLNTQEYQKFSHSKIQFDDCEQVISRNWKGINGRDIGLAEYKTQIEKCNTFPSYFEEQIQDYNNDISSNFDNMKDNFASNFYLNSSNPDPGEMINNLLGIQSIQLINTYSELSRFREAVLSCQNQLIPTSFIKASRLDKALQDIKIKLLPLKYTLASSSLSKLYKMPIADCIYGTTTLTIQILIPIIKTEANFSLLKFSYPHFLYKDKLCRMKSSEDMKWDSESEHFLYTSKPKSLIKTECHSNDRELCHVPDQSQRPLLNKCIFEVLNASLEGIRNECSFQCQKLTPVYKKLILPIIKRVSPTKFVITVDRITTMLIKCEGKHDELITPQEYGAVEINLPCNCYIMYHSERFYSRPPCGNTLFVAHVIPEHMVNSSVSKENKFFLAQPSEKINFSLIVDETVDLVDLSLNYDGTKSSDSGESSNHLLMSIAGLTAQEDLCFRNHIYIWLFVAFQTILCISILTFLYFKINSLDKNCEYGRGAVSFSVSQITNLDDNK